MITLMPCCFNIRLGVSFDKPENVDHNNTYKVSVSLAEPYDALPKLNSLINIAIASYCIATSLSIYANQ